MQTPVTSALILNTKLHKPILRSKLIHRERLVKLLDSGIQRGQRITLISAPAGYGKTTLVTDWLKEASHCSWLSIDPEDNDAAQFFTYLASAFERLGLKSFSPAGLANAALTPTNFETAATRLINEAADLQDNFVIVLDDFHLITNQIILNTLAFLVQHLPPQLHFVILSRTLPSFPLARLRARNQLIEVTSMDLKFNLEEAELFFSRIMGFSLSSENLKTLLERTEGWITGLQLAAISLQRMENSADTSTFIQNFSGSSRLIADYFLEEVLNQQPIQFQHFLLKTAMLERMNASVCEAITGQKDAQNTLECLERTNLFIEPLDNKRSWYRYHTLFSELLKQQYHLETDQKTITTLHNTASRWFSDNGMIYEAVQHAIKARNLIEAARLMAPLNHAALQTIENLPRLVSWIKMIPDEILEQYPDLSILLIKILIYQDQVEQAETTLIALKQKNLQAFVPPSPLFAELSSLEAIVACEQGDFDAGKRIATGGLKSIFETDHCSQAVLNIALGKILLHAGSLIEAEHVLTNAALQSKRAGNLNIMYKSAAHLVLTNLLKGDLRQAIQSGLDLLRVEDIQSILDPATLFQVTLNLSQAYYEINDLKSAQLYAGQSFDYARKSGKVKAQLLAGFQIIFTAAAVGEVETCNRYAEILRNTISLYPTPHLQALYASLKTKYDLLNNDFASASSWANANEERLLCTPNQESLFEHKLLVQFHLLTHTPESNPGILTRLLNTTQKYLQQSENNNNLYEAVELRNLISLIYLALKQERNAVECLKPAIQLAGLKGFTRSFIDLGSPILSLIPKMGYTSSGQRLLSSFNLKKSQAASSIHLKAQLVEPLSKREMEVLKLIAAGLSNKEISSKLYLAQGTVKKHNNNLFSKLDVHRRTEAIARARQLGIL